MKALTICQPYAELIARGDKPIENRTWATPYRGPLAIHAGKSLQWFDPEADLRLYGLRKGDLVLGAVVALAELVACLHVDQAWPGRWRHLKDHEHANGPWCWILENVRRVDTPISARGAQGLWDFHNEVSQRAGTR